MTWQEFATSSLHVGLVVAVISGLIYLWNHRDKAVFLNVALIIMSSQTMVGGWFLCYKSLFVVSCGFTPGEKLYAVVGGMAVIWNSGLAYKRIIPRSKEPVRA